MRWHSILVPWKFWLLGALLFSEARAEPRTEPQATPERETTEAEERPFDEDGTRDSYLQAVSIDDFDIPDEASFEPLWDAAADPNLTFTSPHCSLDLAAGAERQPIGESFYVSVTLSMPLLGCRPIRAPLRDSVARPASQTRLVAWEAGSEAAGVTQTEALGPGEAADRESADKERPALTLRPLPRGFLAEFRRRVLDARGLERSEQRIDGLIRRERTAGLLPELRLRGAHGLDQSLASASNGALPGENTTRGGSDLLFEARLTFRLQRLVIGDGEIALERQRQSVIDKSHDALEDALDQLLIFRKASVFVEAPDRAPEEELEAQLLAEGARIRLHVLTGGWFPLEGPLPGEPNHRID